MKCTLNEFCKNDYVKSKLNDITLNINKIIFETYLLANLHIIRLLDEGINIPALNQGFFQNAIALTSKLYNRKEKKCNDSKLQDTFDCYKQTRPNSYKVGYRDFITSILNYVAADMETATLNHLVLNFYKRCTNYIRKNHPHLTKKQVYDVMTNVYSETYEGSDPIALNIRNALGNIPPTEENVKKNPTSIINVYSKILTYSKANKLRLFSLLPTKNSFNMSHITIDKSALRDIIVEGQLLPGAKGEIRKYVAENPMDVFEHFFRVKKYETNRKKFVFFKTDGNAVSIVFKDEEGEQKKSRLKKKQRDDVPAASEYDVSVGIDPGLRYLFVGKSNENADSKKETVRMSSKQYYHDCSFNWTAQKQQ